MYIWHQCWSKLHQLDISKPWLWLLCNARQIQSHKCALSKFPYFRLPASCFKNVADTKAKKRPVKFQTAKFALWFTLRAKQNIFNIKATSTQFEGIKVAATTILHPSLLGIAFMSDVNWTSGHVRADATDVKIIYSWVIVSC